MTRPDLRGETDPHLTRGPVASRVSAVRKRDPNDVIDDYKALLDSSLTTWRATCQQVSTDALRKAASADAFLNAAIGWETFRSDWHIAAINRDSSAFVLDLAERVEQSVAARWPGLRNRVSLSVPVHPSLNLVRDLLDPEGGNISFGERDRWTARVERELADPYRSVILAMSDRDHRLIRAVVAIRDCLTHRSVKASDAMNVALTNLAFADRGLRRNQQRVRPSGIGAYLFAQAGRRRRVELYHQRLRDIAEALAV